MKQKIYSNDDYIIVLKTPDDFSWQSEIASITTPMTVTFAISSIKPDQVIKKIVWDFGTGNKQKSITNRKQDLHIYGTPCKYKKSNNTTITIQASVYTDQEVYYPQPITAITLNQLIRDHYVEPEEFKQQIITYYNTKIFSNDVADSIYKIANRLAYASNFINYTYREDMIGDAVVRMIEALTAKKFDPLRGNPFSYFTKIAFNAFCNRIKKEKKSRDALTGYQNEVYSSMKGEGILPYSRGDNSPDSFDSDQSHDIQEYSNEDI
jgi:hypothetical protein